MKTFIYWLRSVSKSTVERSWLDILLILSDEALISTERKVIVSWLSNMNGWWWWMNQELRLKWTIYFVSWCIHEQKNKNYSIVWFEHDQSSANNTDKCSGKITNSCLFRNRKSHIFNRKIFGVISIAVELNIHAVIYAI